MNNKKRYFLAHACAALMFPLALSLHARPEASTAPIPPRGASEVVALPSGEWLSLEKRDLRLLDVQGQERAKIAVRGKQLDARALTTASKPSGVIAVLLDSDANQPLLLRAAGGQITRLPDLPTINFSIEAICLGRDRQQLINLYLVGKEGISEHWILHDSGNQLVRTLALPPHAAACRVDDDADTLYVADHDTGVWAIDISREGSHQRALIAQRAPWGKLKSDAGALALLPNGAVAIADGASVHVLRRVTKTESKRNASSVAAWRSELVVANNAANTAAKTTTNAAALTKIDKMFAVPGGARDALWVHDKESKQWRAMSVARSPARAATPQLPIILPRVQTETVARFGDAADDPAIWVNPADGAQSRILGTNKKQGLLVYDMQGKQLQLLEVGRINNVDVRQQVQAGGQRWDLAAATQRDEKGLVLFSISAEGVVKEEARIPTELNDIYGMCAGRSATGEFEVYANDKDGRFVHMRVAREGGKWLGNVLRRFSVSSQPEGCIVDEPNGRVFVGEEKKGVWVLSARAEDAPKLNMILPVGGLLHADVEGLAIYQNGERSYLLVSSQGNDSYVVLDSKPPYAVRGAFRIGINVQARIDGVSETDGIEVTSRALGPMFSRGALIVQDGNKRMPHGPQNFKYVAWEDIAAALRLP
jgi:3-phytase